MWYTLKAQTPELHTRIVAVIGPDRTVDVIRVGENDYRMFHNQGIAVKVLLWTHAPRAKE